MEQEKIPAQMKALVIEGPKKLSYKDVPVPQLADDEVLIQVKACGICGSDVPRVRDGSVHFFPIIVGHEFSGIVAKLGKTVNNAAIGDHVTAAPLIPCGKCNNCSTGHPAMCDHYSFIGSRKNGAMAQYVAVPSKNILHLPKEMDFTEAACIEPLTVAIHGVERVASLKSGSSAIVYGCGTIGMFVLQCLKAKGIKNIFAIDIDDEKLQMAKKLGAQTIINSTKTDVVKYFEEHGLVDYAYETAGVNVLQAQILNLVKKNGSVVYIGTVPRDVSIPAKSFEKILRGELYVTGSWMSYSAPFPGKEWTAAIEYLQSGLIDAESIITHKVPLEEGYKAFLTMFDKHVESLKVMYCL